MKLSILTDCVDQAWLKYILEEFSRISSANFQIEVLHLNQSTSVSSENRIYYTQNNFHIGHWIKNCRSENLISEYTIVDDMTVFNQCKILDTSSCLPFDLFFNSFALLSRKYEYQMEVTGKEIQSYRSRLNSLGKDVFMKPSVNIQFELLERKIKALFPGLTFGAGEKMQVELSHDLDYLEKTLQLRIKQSAFNFFNVLRKLHKPTYALRLLGKSFGFFFRDSEYWNFDYWTEIEKKAEMRSVFYVYSSVGKKSLRTWLLDPSYEVNSNQYLIDVLKEMANEGFEIGLHGSINSYKNYELLKQERDELSASIGIPIKKSRQHWLMYSEKITPAIHEKLFEFDSTLAWNDCMGFRASCCSRYRPFDHRQNRALNYFITPQVVMDSQLFDYAADKLDEAYKTAEGLVEISSKQKNSCISISWHPRTSHPDYNWQEPYEKLLTKLNSLKS